MSEFAILFLPTKKDTEGNKEGATRGGGSRIQVSASQLQCGFQAGVQSCCVSKTLP